MKTTEEITETIRALQAEFDGTIARANYLQGKIDALKGMIAEPKPPEPPGKKE